MAFLLVRDRPDLPDNPEEDILDTTAELKDLGSDAFISLTDSRLEAKVIKVSNNGPCEERFVHRCHWEGGGSITCRFVKGIKYVPHAQPATQPPLETIFESPMELTPEPPEPPPESPSTPPQSPSPPPPPPPQPMQLMPQPVFQTIAFENLAPPPCKILRLSFPASTSKTPHPIAFCLNAPRLCFTNVLLPNQ